MKLKVITSFEQERYIDFMCSQGFDVTRVAKGDGGEADTIERMRGYSAVAVMDETFSAPVLEALKDELKILVRLGIGYDKVDTAYAAKLGICCCNTPGVMSAGVAEQTITTVSYTHLDVYKRQPLTWCPMPLSGGTWCGAPCAISPTGRFLMRTF